MTTMIHRHGTSSGLAAKTSACLDLIGSMRRIEWAGSQAEPKAYPLNSRQVGHQFPPTA